MGNFKPPNEANAVFNLFKNSKQCYYMYFVFSHLTIDNLMSIIQPKKENFNEKLFIECNIFTKQNASKETRHLYNEFLLIMLKIHYNLITEQK